jgi:4-alpha-glucanotransferase
MTVFDRRRAGILLHPTSLPGGAGNGDLGADARRFVDFLIAGGSSVWQLLPHGPTHEDRSPYQCLSVHAGNPLWIDLQSLLELGWLRERPQDPAREDQCWRYACLREARAGFVRQASREVRDEYETFLSHQGHWLEEFALYMALRRENHQRPWPQWPAPARERDLLALAEARDRLADDIEQARFEQFVFFRQWRALKRYANERGVFLFGDMPIFVSYDSADVWAAREYFDLNPQGRPQSVAGVPPDYFSETGQRWGNPLYRWDRMHQDGFQWWRDRVRTNLALYDIARIDHFRGFEAYWAIPAQAATAVEGHWVKAPGEALFSALRAEFGSLALVAENLGVITPEVEVLRHRFGLPGMKVLQFAFDSGPDNPYLPHNHGREYVVYTGTHDNNTTLGWFDALPRDSQERVMDYLGRLQETMPWPLIRAALASVAQIAIVPMQDVLMLGSEHRMNTPATTEGNWRWRFRWDQVPENLSERLRHLVHMYGRG